LKTLALLAALLAAAATAAVAAPLPSLNDEFNDPATTAQWQVLQGDLADGVEPTFDISKTTPGELTITPGYGDTKADLASHVDWIHFASTGVPGPLRRAVLAGRRPPAALVRYLNR
jgi:hypothetical protein